MLHFLYGRAAAGKSTVLMNEVQNCIDAEKAVVILVPEQFSFDTEKDILHRFGDEKAAKITVLSFTRLCDIVDHELGGGCDHTLSDIGKIILMNRALRECAPQLKVWGRQAASEGFCETILNSIAEFKIEAISPEQLREAAGHCEQSRLAAKLEDVALIYDCYNALTEQFYIDPTDRITKLYDRLTDYRYFDNKTVFVDTFKGFSGQQYRILERIISQADAVHIALTFDPTEKRRFDIFENVRKTAEKLKKIARSHRVEIDEEYLTPKENYVSDSLSAVEKILSGKPVENAPKDHTVTVCAAETIYDEAEFVARTIRRLVRENGYRYRDFVVIAREIAAYEEAMSAACEKNKVGCFIDRRMPLIDFPPIVAVLSAFEAIKSFSTESILRFHKSGISLLTVDEISTLENYCFLWNINGKKWLDSWTMNPDGLQASEGDRDYTHELEELNKLRLRAMVPLQKFQFDFHGTAAERGTAIMNLLNRVHAQKSFADLRKSLSEKGDPTRGEALRQSYDYLIAVLDDLNECFGAEDISDDTYRKTFSTAVSFVSVGVAPQTLDEVSFGAADRIRPARPKIAFILGCNQGVFPRSAAPVGLFGVNDRSDMIRLGLEISDRTVTDAIEEMFLIYTNLCCSSDRLYLSYTSRNAKQEECTSSNFVSQIADAIDCEKLCEPAAKMDALHLPETADAAFSEACLRGDFNQNSGGIMSVLTENGFAERAGRVQHNVERKSLSLDGELAEKLYGKQLRVSATGMDTFYKCRFQYFCRYGIKAKKLQPAEFDRLQRGTVVHYILQRVFELHRDNFGQLDDETIKNSVCACTEEYLNRIPGFNAACTPLLQVLVENIKRSTVDVVKRLRDEFAQSQFVPNEFEFKFGLEGKEPIRIADENGEILLNGSIDRVDSWNGYLRIVDYKTGHKDFTLSDVLIGQNVQMLLYLFAISRYGDFSDVKSAGIFYLPARRDKKGEGLPVEGLMTADETLVRAMDRTNSGNYAPKYELTKQGVLSSNAQKSFVDEQDFEVLFDYIESLLKRMRTAVCNGDIAVDPIDCRSQKACKYCDFAVVCGIEDRPHKKAEKFSNAQVIEQMRKQLEVNADGR